MYMQIYIYVYLSLSLSLSLYVALRCPISSREGWENMYELMQHGQRRGTSENDLPLAAREGLLMFFSLLCQA